MLSIAIKRRIDSVDDDSINAVVFFILLLFVISFLEISKIKVKDRLIPSAVIILMFSRACGPNQQKQ